MHRKSNKKNTPSHIAARRKKSQKRIEKFNKKKAEEQQKAEEQARSEALRKLGISQDFGFGDHQAIYNFANCRETAPIEIIDASIPPPTVIEYSRPEFSMPAAAEPERAAVYCRAHRAKAIFQMHFQDFKGRGFK